MMECPDCGVNFVNLVGLPTKDDPQVTQCTHKFGCRFHPDDYGLCQVPVEPETETCPMCRKKVAMTVGMAVEGEKCSPEICLVCFKEHIKKIVKSYQRK